MYFGLNDEQKMMIDTIRRFITKELHPLEDEVENAGVLDPVKAKAIFEKSKALGRSG
jgi:acyl-CoA dehydrogenase